MRRIFKTIMFAVAVVTLVASCKKDDTKPFKRVLTKMDSGGFDTYEYNSAGKISKQKSDNGRSISYSYTSNAITTTSTYKLNSGKDTIVPSTYIVALNAQGNVSIVTNTEAPDTSGNEIETKSYSETVEYDAAGYPTKDVQTNTTTKKLISSNIETKTTEVRTKTFTYTNNNLISEVTTKVSTSSTGAASTMTTIATYEYYLDKENSLSNERTGMTFLGKSSRNLVKSETSTTTYSPTSSSTPASTWSSIKLYEFDQDGLVSKVTNVSANSTSWVSYTYK